MIHKTTPPNTTDLLSALEEIQKPKNNNNKYQRYLWIQSLNQIKITVLFFFFFFLGLTVKVSRLTYAHFD